MCYKPLTAIAGDSPTMNDLCINPTLTHPLNTSSQDTLSTHPINPPSQPTLSTHPINPPYQPTLSTHPLNTFYQTILSTHPVNTPSQHIFSTHSIKPSSQHTLSQRGNIGERWWGVLFAKSRSFVGGYGTITGAPMLQWTHLSRT